MNCYRIMHADSGEIVLLEGQVDYDIEAVEAEIRRRPEQFALIPDPVDYAPHGLIVRAVYIDDDRAETIPLSHATRIRLELLRVQELAREAVDVWQGGPSMYDAEEFDVAMSALRAALPPRPHAPIATDPDDPF